MRFAVPIALLLVLLALSSDANANVGGFTLVATARCLKGNPAVSRTFASKGSLYVTLRDRAVPELTFYSNEAVATAALKRAMSVSKSLGVTLPSSISHVAKNVLVSWSALPGTTDAHAIEACLR